MLWRTPMIHHGRLSVTPDTRDALVQLDAKAKELGWRIGFKEHDPEEPFSYSLAFAGRGFELELSHDDTDDYGDRVTAAWGMAIPLGFSPAERHLMPVPDRHMLEFHYFGPWQPILDRLMAEGRGHLAYQSMCCAALVDVGKWQWGKETERFIQAQFHRLGLNVGAIDGVIGPRTAQAIEAKNLTGKSLEEMANILKEEKPLLTEALEPSVGHLVVPGQKMVVATFGGIKAVHEGDRAMLRIDAPGRLVVDIGGS